MLTESRHARVIVQAETLARATFADVIPCGALRTDEVADLQKEFLALLRVLSRRYDSLKADLNKWRKCVRLGEVDFDSAREDDFKGGLRALVSAVSFLLEQFDAYRDRGILLAKSLLVAFANAHSQEATKVLDSWRSPEWEADDERAVKWDEEQTNHLWQRLGL